MFMFADMDNYLSTKGYGNGLSIDGDLDLDKLEYLYQGLKDRGLSDSEALNVIQRMKSESNLDAYSESEEGDGLMPELGYRNNMFSEYEDTEIDRQLNAVVNSIRKGKIKADTISGALDSEITRGLGFNSFSEGGDVETADNGTESEFAWYPSDSILNYIKKVEGYRPYWYKDGNGVMTIGYGFTDTGLMKTHPKWMSRVDADKRFKEEIDSRISSFISATPNFDKLTDSQRDALFDYYYNIGHGNYTKGSPGMQAALAAGDLYAVRDSIDIGYNDKNNAGLRQRRDYERSLFGLESAPELLAPVGRRKISYDIPVWDSKTALWATKQKMKGRVMQNKFMTGGNLYDGKSLPMSNIQRKGELQTTDKERVPLLHRLVGWPKMVEDATRGTIKRKDFGKIYSNPNTWATLFFSPEQINEIRQKLYDNFYPVGYNLERLKVASDVAFGDGDEISERRSMYDSAVKTGIPKHASPIGKINHPGIRDEALSYYLTPEKVRTRWHQFLLPTDLRPASGATYDRVFAFNRKENKHFDTNLVESYNNAILNKVYYPIVGTGGPDGSYRKFTRGKTKGFYTVDSFGSGPFSQASGTPEDNITGTYTISSGVDPLKGEYISFYDDYDINPLVGGNSAGNPDWVTRPIKSRDASGGIGNPFSIYDRVYLDDYYGVSSRPNIGEFYGGYIIPAVITTE